MAKFLYLLTTYKLQDQALRLIDVLHQGGTDPLIVVRHDAKTEPLNPRLANHPGVYVAPGHVPVHWGDSSYLDALLETFAWALERFEFDWLTLLSGQDYPLMPIHELERLQADSGFDGFIQALPLDRSLPPEQVAVRTQYRWSTVPTPWPGGQHVHAATVRALERVEPSRQPRWAAAGSCRRRHRHVSFRSASGAAGPRWRRAVWRCRLVQRVAAADPGRGGLPAFANPAWCASCAPR